MLVSLRWKSSLCNFVKDISRKPWHSENCLEIKFSWKFSTELSDSGAIFIVHWSLSSQLVEYFQLNNLLKLHHSNTRPSNSFLVYTNHDSFWFIFPSTIMFGLMPTFYFFQHYREKMCLMGFELVLSPREKILEAF